MTDTLILKCIHKKKTLEQEVYTKTLTYLSRKLFSTEVYQYSSLQSLVKKLQKESFKTVVSTCDIPSDVAHILRGFGLVQIVIGHKKELEDIVDIVIDPLIRKSERFLVGTKYLLPSIVRQMNEKKIAYKMGISEELLREEVAHSQAEIELLNVTSLFKKLKWDSNFFGINVGFVSCLRLTENIQKHIAEFVMKEKIDIMEYLCNCHDRESVLVSERYGYSFVDIRITFECAIGNLDVEYLCEGYSVRKGKVTDVPHIRHIASNSYKYSRYYFDEHFNRDKVIEFYVNWAAKAIHGEFDDYAYVLIHQKKVIGFCSIKKVRKKGARIGLVGVDRTYHGKGLARQFIMTCLKNLKADGIDYVEVVTQGRNYAAQRLYQKCGFITKTTELWYHKWLR